ncbi:glycosyltransferase family 2 protein [Flavobacterium sp.]|uniref:glycosyltransferase family 2 protein n=1 Tax=Flavobacterium sp. TaxID=239 RepID=UPI003751B316
MISILIPTYNYNTYILVEELYKQISKENVDFEIIVVDDASPKNEITQENYKINTLKNCLFERNEINLGRSKNRNLLISKAKYKWVLLLDGDVYPKEKKFITNYLNSINCSDKNIFFGGIEYNKKTPNDEEMLRWVFGKKREEINLQTRLLKPYHHALISNILIKKDLFLTFSFDKEITNYGYEDILFILNLKKNKIKIEHIDNAVFHMNLENSQIFLDKFHSSLKNLKIILDQKKINTHDTSLTKTYYWISKLKMIKLTAYFFKIFKSTLTQNLVSSNPSLLIFDIYRLGYFCTLK